MASHDGKPKTYVVVTGVQVAGETGVVPQVAKVEVTVVATHVPPVQSTQLELPAAGVVSARGFTGLALARKLRSSKYRKPKGIEKALTSSQSRPRRLIERMSNTYCSKHLKQSPVVNE